MPNGKRFARHIYALIFGLLLAAPLAKASESLAEAQKLYGEGQFEKSRALFWANRQDPGFAKSSAYFFNYGLAALNAGAAGEAYVALHRAASLDPLDSGIQKNLRSAEAKISPALRSFRPATWISWWPANLRGFPWPVWLMASLLLLAPYLWFAKSEQEFLSWHGSFLLGAGIFGFMALAELWQSRMPAGGALSITKVMSGPGSTYPGITSLEPGALVNLEEERPGWIKIRYINPALQETVGWVESPTVLKF